MLSSLGHARRLSSERIKTVRKHYTYVTRLTSRLFAYSLKMSIERAQAIATVNPKLAAGYLVVSLGNPDVHPHVPYHQVLAPTVDDKIYDSVCAVYKGLSEVKLPASIATGMGGEIIDSLTYLGVHEPKIVSDFFRYVTAAEINKVEAILNLQESDYDRLKEVRKLLKKTPDAALTELDFSHSVFVQLEKVNN
ncbi:MAG: hypothetical protein ABIC04_07535 [Nanoarchaeota archaeon]